MNVFLGDGRRVKKFVWEKRRLKKNVWGGGFWASSYKWYKMPFMKKVCVSTMFQNPFSRNKSLEKQGFLN
jgi:hypothetical protein